MSILLKHIVRNIKESKLKSALIIFSIIISTMVVFLTLSIKDDLRDRYTDLLKNTYKDYDLLIQKPSSEKIREFSKDDINLKNIDSKDEFKYDISYGTYDKDNEVVTIRFYELNREDLINKKLCEFKEVSENYDYKNKNQIIISEAVAKDYDFKLDEKIKVKDSQGEKELTIAAIADNTGLYKLEEGSVIFMTTEDFNLDENSTKISKLLIDLKEGTNIKEAKDTLSEDNKEFVCSKTVDERAVSASLNIFSQIMMVILITVTILNICIIGSIMKLIIAGRMPVIGTFRSIGCSKVKVNFILLLESALYGIIGGAIGVGTALLFKSKVVDIFADLNGTGTVENNTTSVIDVGYVLISLAFSVILVLLISLRYIAQASKKPVKNIIFNTLSTTVSLSKIKIGLGIIILGISVILLKINSSYNLFLSALAMVSALTGGILVIPIIIKTLSHIFSKINSIFSNEAALAAKNISTSKVVESNVTLVSVALSIIIMLYMLSISLNVIFKSAANSFDADLQISNFAASEEKYYDLKDVEGVESIDFCYYTSVDYNNSDITLMALNEEKLGVYDSDNLLGKIDRDEILIDKDYALKNHLSVKDDITIKNDDDKYTYNIAGFIDSAEFSIYRNVFVINLDEYKDKFSEIPTVCEVKAQGSITDTKNNLKEKLSGLNSKVITVDDYMKSQEDSVSSLVKMVYTILSLSVLLTFVGVVNNQIIGFMQRKKEFAVMYSVAMNMKQLIIMLVFETLDMFFISSIIGGVFSLYLVKLLERLLFSIGVFINISVNHGLLMSAVGIILVLLMLTVISPIRACMKMNIVNELKCE